MNEFTEEQNIKLGNFKEQLAAIRREIQTENAKLESVLGELQETSEALLATKKEIADSVADIKSIADRKIALEEAIEIEEQVHFDVINSLNSTIATKESVVKDIDLQINNLNKILNDLHINLSTKEKEFSRKLASFENTVLKSKNDIDILNEQKAYIIDSISKLSVQKIESENTIRLLSEYISERTEKLNVINSAIANAALMVEEPLRSLKIREEEFEKKEKAMQILYTRTKKMFEKVYPGQNLDNLIKL